MLCWFKLDHSAAGLHFSAVESSIVTCDAGSTVQEEEDGSLCLARPRTQKDRSRECVAGLENRRVKSEQQSYVF